MSEPYMHPSGDPSKVVIVMRTKNRPLLLKRAIGSVLQQNLHDWHLAIVNDGGDIAAVEQSVKPFLAALEGRLTVCHHAQSKGVAAASNTAIHHTKSRYIAHLDDDDTWEPSFLENTLAFLDQQPESSRVQGVATYANAITEMIAGECIATKSKSAYALQPKQICLSHLLLENQFTNLSFVYRRSILDLIGLYDEELYLFEDWDFNLRFAKEAEIGLLPWHLVNYHFRLPTSAAGSGSHSGSDNTLGLKSNRNESVALFRDYQLRKDLKNGSVGIGTLMHLSHQHLKQIPERVSLLRAIKHDCLWIAKKLRGFSRV